MGVVKVLNLSSVLEIEFAMNFIFLVVELRPIVERRWRIVYRKTDPTKAVLWKRQLFYGENTFGPSVRNDIFIITGWGCDLLALILTAGASIGALRWLIAAGFDPDLTMPRSEATEWMLALFLPVPSYFGLSMLLQHSAIVHIKRVQKRFGINPDRPEDQYEPGHTGAAPSPDVPVPRHDDKKKTDGWGAKSGCTDA